MDSSVIKLLARQSLLRDETVRQEVEEAVVKGSIQNGLIVVQNILNAG